jgi:hypothetical protein
MKSPEAFQLRDPSSNEGCAATKPAHPNTSVGLRGLASANYASMAMKPLAMSQSRSAVFTPVSACSTVMPSA